MAPKRKRDAEQKTLASTAITDYTTVIKRPPMSESAAVAFNTSKLRRMLRDAHNETQFDAVATFVRSNTGFDFKTLVTGIPKGEIVRVFVEMAGRDSCPTDLRDLVLDTLEKANVFADTSQCEVFIGALAKFSRYDGSSMFLPKTFRLNWRNQKGTGTSLVEFILNRGHDCAKTCVDIVARSDVHYLTTGALYDPTNPYGRDIGPIVTAVQAAIYIDSAVILEALLAALPPYEYDQPWMRYKTGLRRPLQLCLRKCPHPHSNVSDLVWTAEKVTTDYYASVRAKARVQLDRCGVIAPLIDIVLDYARRPVFFPVLL